MFNGEELSIPAEGIGDNEDFIQPSSCTGYWTEMVDGQELSGSIGGNMSRLDRGIPMKMFTPVASSARRDDLFN